MKEEKLLQMKNKVESLANVIQHILQEMNNLRDLSVGTLETLKLMPDYEEALGKLKENLIESQKKEKEEPEPKLE
tara:strand:- start:177 stop:401 length:225 start_codon:yes stop_codon:yes gene_type:complete